MEDRQPVFDITHKALRNILGRFSLLAGRIDYRDGADLAMLKELGRELRSMLKSPVSGLVSTHAQVSVPHRPLNLAAKDLELVA